MRNAIVRNILKDLVIRSNEMHSVISHRAEFPGIILMIKIVHERLPANLNTICLKRLSIIEQWDDFDPPGCIKLAFLIYRSANLNFHA